MLQPRWLQIRGTLNRERLTYTPDEAGTSLESEQGMDGVGAYAEMAGHGLQGLCQSEASFCSQMRFAEQAEVGEGVDSERA
ncbi:hypothetical protein AK812_SmicGene12163 [Symbiodinium microadriaticum]|uniref:Uncharacterized protein n=1 Tax=Symbiodinium microadriaticum TaxID=2951 RepID=A0A1Q9EBF3_SYMMI|nr:hypothetical protein AK812_SmicGene12163 [Symbiodinium microadriaticum]